MTYQRGMVPPLSTHLTEAWRLLAHHALTLAGIHAVVLSVSAVVFLGALAVPAAPIIGFTTAVGAGVLSFVLGVWANLATFTVLLFRDRPWRVADAYRQTASQVPGFLGLTIVLMCIVGLGYALLVIPGVLLSVAVFVSVPVYLAETTSVSGSLARSWRYIRGYAGVTLMRVVVVLVLMAIVNVGVGLFMAPFPHQSPTNPFGQIVSLIVGTMLSIYMAAFIVCYYRYLRRLKGKVNA